MSLLSDPGAGDQPRGHGGRPSRLESAQLSDRILDVATALFLGDGFGATSIEAVAKRAGVSKRTFYHRFSGKEMLFEAVVRRMIERWTPPFDEALLNAPNLASGLRRAAEHMLRVALTPEALALHRMVIAEARRFPGLARILHELGAAAAIERPAARLRLALPAPWCCCRSGPAMRRGRKIRRRSSWRRRKRARRGLRRPDPARGSSSLPRATSRSKPS